MSYARHRISSWLALRHDMQFKVFENEQHEFPCNDWFHIKVVGNPSALELFPPQNRQPAQLPSSNIHTISLLSLLPI